MPEMIQDWLGTKLGVVIDMSPEKFGRNTKDGKLLAKLLYNYGVIPAHILKNVKESKNYYECYNNLVVLKPWLKHIGVTHDESTFHKMAGGEGSAAISIFYSVYLNLEGKDRLHYLSAQKERRGSLESCQKFKVSLVPEKLVPTESGDSGLEHAALIFENSDIVDWHKVKCKELIEHIKKTKAKFQKRVKKEKELGPLVSKHASSKPLDKKQMEAEETIKSIKAFEKNHPEETHNPNFAELIEMKNVSEVSPCVPNMIEAQNIVATIRRRKKGEVYARNFQQKMQHVLLDEQWKEIIEKQEKDFENKVCASLLKQSQYEKQMAKKLYLIRQQKRVLAENRKKIEILKIDECQKEYDEIVQQNMELNGEYWEDEEIEKERIQELHRRLYDDKARIRRELIKMECRKIFEAFSDIAIRISEFRELIGCQIPKSLMKDLKELFYKDLPIFDVLEHLEDLCVKDLVPSFMGECPEEGQPQELFGETDFYENQAYKKLKSEEMERQSVLDDCDFNDYICLMGPWMVELLFPDASETEVKQLVLGYIVHKLLGVKYPAPNVPTPVNMKPMKPTSIVHGLNDDTAINMLIDLMEACGILVVRVNDAINFVLSAYKEELPVEEDIDAAFQIVTESAMQQGDLNEKGKVNRKLQLLKEEDSESTMLMEEFFMLDKEVQTPRNIPEEDAVLSPIAELGKQAFEALGVGDPVPDEVIASAVAAYVASKQDNYDGWVILNYPHLYYQASQLEYILTGYRTLPLLEEMETMEEAEGFSCRGPWCSYSSNDMFKEFRVSKLVPRPDILVPQEREIPKTYFDSIIKLKKPPGTSLRRSQDSEELDVMEKFYLDLEILLEFEYQNLNFQTMKELAKQILGIGSTDDVTESELTRKNSLEIFGNVIYELAEKWEPKRKSTKDTAGGIKKVSNEMKGMPEHGRSATLGSHDPYDEGVSEDKLVELDGSVSPRPGEPGWEWATGDQSEDFQVALAGLWENMEAVYIEDFKTLFFVLRVHRLNVVNYCGFVRKSLRILMKRPDEKQKVLGDFQKMYNEIDEDLRPDVDIKCELHVRVSELEQALMSMADERKKNTLKDMSQTSQDGWASDELANLVNAFLTALQLEADRSIDSCQVIMDYYISLQQKIPDVKTLKKVIVPKLLSRDRIYSVSSSTSKQAGVIGSPRFSDPKRNPRSISDPSKVTLMEKFSKTKSLPDKRKRSSDSVLTGAAEFISEILLELRLPEDGVTPFHTFFFETVQAVAVEVKSTLENCLMEAKRADKTAPSATGQTKTGKNPSDVNVVSNENLTLEWTTALENEISRFSFRSQLILSRGIFDMNEFLTTILNILSSLSEEITEMYLKEIHSIAECCKVFKCGIEEEIAIKPILELRQEEFLVHVEETTPSTEKFSMDVNEEEKRFTFTMVQLNILFSKLQRVAPDGEIIKRSLVYIFEDLRMLNPEVEGCKCFPEVWNDIEADDLTIIMNEVYQDLEIVHWKDFIIYALEIPVPTITEILLMRKLFRRFDPLLSELITRENYDCISLWFEKYSNDVEMEKCRAVKDLLYRMYQVTDLQTNYSALLLAFCKDEDPVVGFEKALALAMGKEIKRYDETPRESIQGEIQLSDYSLFDDYYKQSVQKPMCCPTSSTELKCIPKEKIVRCECKDKSESSSLEECEVESEVNYGEEAGEGFFKYSSKLMRQSLVPTLIPFNILSSLLKASFPSLPQLSILLDCQETFQETLNAIYNSLDSYDNVIDIKKLVNHTFIQRLLLSTNKFKFVKLKEVLRSVANAPILRAPCVREKPKMNYCLRN